MDSLMEDRAAASYAKGDYYDAVAAYTACIQCINPTDNKSTLIALYFNRSACYLKLKQHVQVVEDCDKVLELAPGNGKALYRKIKALCSLGKFIDAHKLAEYWLETDSKSTQAKKEVGRLDIIVKAFQDQECEDDGLEVSLVSGERIPPEGKEDDKALGSPSATTGIQAPAPTIPSAPSFNMSVASATPTFSTPSLSPTSNLCVEEDELLGGAVGGIAGAPCLHPCSYCFISFETAAELATHCQSDLHHKKVSSDEGGDWKHRPPPRGLTNEEYSKCPRYFGEGTCRFGARCSQAHSETELTEWKERFQYKKERMKAAKENNLQGNTYAEQLLEKWMSAENPESVMTDNMEGVNVHVHSDLSLTMTSKQSTNSWTFTVTSKVVCLRRVALLDEASRRYFFISSITVGPKRSQKSQKIEDNCQEWTDPNYNPEKTSTERVYRIKVVFRTDIFGTFRQSVVCDFGSEPVLVRELCVDSSPVVDIDKITQDIILNETGRWDISQKTVIPYKPKLQSNDEIEEQLLERYGPLRGTKFSLSPCLLEPDLRRETYKQRMHDLLSIEEMAQFSSVAKYNVKTTLQLVNRFLLMPSTVSTAKFAQGGELFARMKLNSDISEDTSHGRLILQNVQCVYLAPYDPNKPDEEPQVVYEAIVEEKGKNFIFLRLSSQCVSELGLFADLEFMAQAQFQLNRLPLCENHLAIDSLPTLDLVFPAPTAAEVPWNPKRQWSDQLDARLNTKQKEAIVAITTDLTHRLAPILIVGPYGTGKTFTLAQAATQLLSQPDTRVLICTHSNSAADLYIRDYLHPHVHDGHPEARPLRIYYRNRWVQTVNPIILEYCLVGNTPQGTCIFKKPTKEDVEKHRVIVATLSTSRYLQGLGLEEGFFTHILLDEAAQAQECETLMPLAMAGSNTRIVLAGDHMQLSPEVHSDFARERSFHISFLERLYDMFPAESPSKILLCENYRSHKAIIDYTSELFYDSKLVTSGNQPRHEVFYPLTFFTARGEDMQHQNSTGFYNNAEVYEIVERVSELQKAWPKGWGSILDECSIGVVSPYADQVVRIRSELRKRKLGNVSVERVFNVQGKQFRVIFLSTVRTRHTCSSDSALEDFMDYGFLSNVKLLNTAITRAQSLVAVVGDPVSLCSIGKCRKLWERFIELCHKNNSLFGITWNHLRAQLDGVELKKTYILNPLAPEFVPNRLRHAPYAPPEPVAIGKYGYTFVPRPPAPWNKQRFVQPHMNPRMLYPQIMGGPPMMGAPPFIPFMQPGTWPRNIPFNPHAAKVTGPPLHLPPPHSNKVERHYPHSVTSSANTPTTEHKATSTAPSSKPGDGILMVPSTPAQSQGSLLIKNTGQPGHLPPQVPLGPGFAGPPKSVPGFQTQRPGMLFCHPRLPVTGPPPFPSPPNTFYQQQPAYNMMMSPRGMGMPMAGLGMHPPPPPPPHPLLGPRFHQQQNGFSPAPPMQHMNGHVARNIMVNVTQPDHTKTYFAPHSPADSDRSTPHIEFLPNVCNVKNSPENSPSSGGSRQQDEEHALFQNMYLQREFYSYILQTEGVVAANKYMQFMQQHQNQQTRWGTNDSAINYKPVVTKPKREVVSVQLEEPSRSVSRESSNSLSAASLDLSDMSDRSSDICNTSWGSGHSAGRCSNGYATPHGAPWHNVQASSVKSTQPSWASVISSRGATFDCAQTTVHQSAVQLTVPNSHSNTSSTSNRQEYYAGRIADRAAHRELAQQDTAIIQSTNDILSEDLELPSAVDHMVRFIEDSLDDKSNDDIVPRGSEYTNGDTRQVPLYMRRGGQTSQASPQPMSYAGALRRQPQPPPAAVLRTSQSQNPPTQIDPLDVLKNLNIKASPGTQAFYQYFS